MKIKIVFFLILFSAFCNAQIINIPDINLKNKLLSASPSNQIASTEQPNYISSNNSWSAPSYTTIDTNNDGQIQVSEALEIKYLNVSFSVMYNATGLESFTNLIYLDVSHNSLTNINIDSLTQIQAFNCCYNYTISTLNLSQNTNLKHLLCHFNQITTLDVTNCNQLFYLYCTDNDLSSINLSGLTLLEHLVCYKNELSSLDLTGLTSLEFANISNNNLTELTTGILPNLTNILCSNNQFTTLDFNDLYNLNYVYCVNNLQLKQLYLKNGKIEPNSNIVLDNCPNLEYICCDQNQLYPIEFLLNEYGYTDCVVGTYCSFEPGGNYNTISGRVQFDYNNDGCDENDINPFNMLIRMIGSGTGVNYTSADQSGGYIFYTTSGNYNIKPLLENPYYTVSPVSVTGNFANSNNNTAVHNFCITTNGVHNDLEIRIIPLSPAIPGFDNNYKIVYKNKGNQTLGGDVTLNYDESTNDLFSTSEAPTVQTSGQLGWSFANLIPFETRTIDVVFNLNTPTETPPVNQDDILNFTATINTAEQDETPEDNSFELNQIVVNSYDPNDKTCLEGTELPIDKVGDYITYMIRFENNGTYSARNIIVRDEINQGYFDVNSIIPITASHAFTMRITQENIVEFLFENINLPFDDANNGGYVVFKIKNLPDLAVNESFSNYASIYFDYNPPIVTNEFTTTIVDTNLASVENEFKNRIQIHPNPVKDFLKFRTEENITKIEIFDLIGRNLISSPLFNNEINLSELKSGEYILKLYTKEETMNAKIIKE